MVRGALLRGTMTGARGAGIEMASGFGYCAILERLMLAKASGMAGPAPVGAAPAKGCGAARGDAEGIEGIEGIEGAEGMEGEVCCSFVSMIGIFG